MRILLVLVMALVPALATAEHRDYHHDKGPAPLQKLSKALADRRMVVEQRMEQMERVAEKHPVIRAPRPPERGAGDRSITRESN